MKLENILSPNRTFSSIAGSSRKRVLEKVSGRIADQIAGVEADDIFDALIQRELMGSTGLGQGIAIPHCRVANCAAPIGSLLTLEEGIDFDAPDNRPVDLLFVLLVPEEAHQEHLDILAEIARLFSQHDFCKRLRGATDNAVLYEIACNGDG